MSAIKDKIIQLRLDGKSYNEIETILNCSKSSISHYCKIEKINDIGLSKKQLDSKTILEMKEFYKTNTIIATCEKFKISKSTVTKYCDTKRFLFANDIDRKNANYLNLKSYRQKNKEKAIEYKGGRCKKCGYDRCINAFDFHHLDPNEKEINISMILNNSWDIIKKELDKCVLLCSNCHRELHTGLFTML